MEPPIGEVVETARTIVFGLDTNIVREVDPEKVWLGSHGYTDPNDPMNYLARRGPVLGFSHGGLPMHFGTVVEAAVLGDTGSRLFIDLKNAATQSAGGQEMVQLAFAEEHGDVKKAAIIGSEDAIKRDVR